MNSKTNDVLSKIRQTLESELKGPGLNEAAQMFCEEGLALISKSGYELEGFEEAGPEEVIDALQAVVEEEQDENIKQEVTAFLASYPGIGEVKLAKKKKDKKDEAGY